MFIYETELKRYRDPLLRSVMNEPFKSYSAAKRWMTDEGGFKQIGVGQNASVFKRDNSPYVIKIAYGDSCWVDYLEWLSEKAPSDNLPTVPWFQKRDGFSIACIEALVPITRHYIYKSEDIGFHLWAMSYSTLDEETRELNLPFLSDNIARPAFIRVQRYFIKQNNHILDDMDVEEFKYYLDPKARSRTGQKIKHELQRAYRDVKSNFKNDMMDVEKEILTPCNLDLHEGNFMYRKESNSIVITDPYNDFTKE